MKLLVGMLLCSLALPLLVAQKQPIKKTTAKANTSVTVPMALATNRPYVDFTLTGPNGHPQAARFWLDTGGGKIILTQALADRLGLGASGEHSKEDGEEFAPTALPAMTLKGKKLGLVDAEAIIEISKSPTLMGTKAEGAFPVRILRNYQVVFDYPRRLFTVADRGTLKPAPGARPAALFLGESGMPVITLSVAGEPHQFLLDTGGTYTMISTAYLDDLRRKHPDWPYLQGAYGPANMGLGPFESKLQMLRLGASTWGAFTLPGFGAVSRPTASYDQWMSKIVGEPIVGSIGGNVFRDFRIQIDFPDSKLYLSQNEKPRAVGHKDDLDAVAITIGHAGDGYAIVGLADGVTQLRKGDQLVSIASSQGALDADKATLAELLSALAGPPGTMKQITVLRDGKLIQASVPTRHLL